jgi:hypothetical protein
MSRSVRSARGRIVDLGALAAQNEKTRAVGNVPMNARGDRLDAKGNVKTKVEDIARVTQTVKTTPKETAVSDPVPITSNSPQEQETIPEPGPEIVSKITRTRDDGSQYMEIEYEDGSIETVEVKNE